MAKMDYEKRNSKENGRRDFDYEKKYHDDMAALRKDTKRWVDKIKRRQAAELAAAQAAASPKATKQASKPQPRRKHPKKKQPPAKASSYLAGEVQSYKAGKGHTRH